MKRDRNKGFYSQKCKLEASIALCFEWAGDLVPWDVLHHFTTLLRALNGVSSEHSCSDCIFRT